MTKQWRFFYHYNKVNKAMTVHFKKKCYVTKDIDCKVPCETKWNKTQPNIVMQGFATEIIVDKDKIKII